MKNLGLTCLALILCCMGSFAQPRYGHNIQASAGQTVNLSARINDEPTTITGRGTPGAPIIISGEKNHTVVTGRTRFSVIGDYIIIKDVQFEDVNLSTGDLGVVTFGDKRLLCNNCQLVNCSFDQTPGFNIKTDGQSFMWVFVNGKSNKIDNCSFEGKTNRYPIIHINATDVSVTGYNVISNCTFKNVQAASFNGLEAIRIGQVLDNVTSGTTVENNTFLNYSGDTETVSSKSDGNTFKNNKFINCRSGISLRFGNSCVVEENYFYQTGNAVRLTGKNHVIQNNTFFGSKLNRTQGGAIVFMMGSNNRNEYKKVENVKINDNKFINDFNVRVLKNTDEAQFSPNNVSFQNNVLYTGQDSVFNIDNTVLSDAAINNSNIKTTEFLNGRINVKNRDMNHKNFFKVSKTTDKSSRQYLDIKKAIQDFKSIGTTNNQ